MVQSLSAPGPTGGVAPTALARRRESLPSQGALLVQQDLLVSSTKRLTATSSGRCGGCTLTYSAAVLIGATTADASPPTRCQPSGDLGSPRHRLGHTVCSNAQIVMECASLSHGLALTTNANGRSAVGAILGAMPLRRASTVSIACLSLVVEIGMCPLEGRNLCWTGGAS